MIEVYELERAILEGKNPVVSRTHVLKLLEGYHSREKVLIGVIDGLMTQAARGEFTASDDVQRKWVDKLIKELA
ncbi:hypothetical protein [Paenibacillus alkalitolerans]|uniref:hypothetical protein n=1 Tax=Paenibacillus alkalitolerans TaxID=2799335 RepID=UPI0018F6D43F|nr:hypothetical protein [Paenibacillus alkalitolerans]